MSKSIKCGECGGKSSLVGGRSIYPHRPDLYHKRFWRCLSCRAYCGCHPNTENPLGYPAGPETRKARNAAHAAFDPLWRSGAMTRREAYQWLSEAMNLPSEQCHIAMMDAAQALQVVRLTDQKRGAPQ